LKKALGLHQAARPIDRIVDPLALLVDRDVDAIDQEGEEGLRAPAPPPGGRAFVRLDGEVPPSLATRTASWRSTSPKS